MLNGSCGRPNDQLGVGAEPLPGRSQSQGHAAALEEPRTDDRLEPSDLLRQGRLGHV